MQKTTTAFTLLAIVAVTSAAICCTPDFKRHTEKAADSRTARAAPAQTTVTGQSSKKLTKPVPKIPKTQILVLKGDDKKDESLISEWKNGENLDWKFISNDRGTMKEFPIHKSLVLKYSSYIKFMHNAMSQRGIDRNYSTLYYPAKIVESLVTLMYEHQTTINKSDYTKLMAAAKSIGFDGFIATSEKNVASTHGKK